MSEPVDPASDPLLLRMLDYQRALGGLSRVASELLPQDRLLHHVTAVVSRVTHIRHVKVLCYRADRADMLAPREQPRADPFPATRRLLVGASGTRVWPAYDQPSVRGRSARALVRWWPPGLGPMFVQASVGRTRYSFTDQVEESFQSGRLVILRGTEVGGGAGAIVPLFRATVAMTPFVHAWRVPDARGTRRTQAGVDVRHETTMTGWQAGLALTLRL